MWGSPSLQAPWSETADSYTTDGSQGGNTSITVTGTAPTTGTVVLCEVNVISKDARDLFAIVRDGIAQLQEGRNRILITAGGGGASRIQIVATSGGVVELEKSSISFKQADGYGTIINGNANDWGLFDKQANGDWKGNGLAVPPWDSVDQVLVTA